MIVVASADGRGGIRQAMETLRRGGTALDAVVAGIEAAERARGARAERSGGCHPPARRAPVGMVPTPPDLAVAQPEVLGRWRRYLAEELSLEAHALARMEWLVRLASAVIGPAPPGASVYFVARDRACDLACGVGLYEADQGGEGIQRLVLALRAGRSLGDALRGALSDLANLAPPLGDRVNLHALARDRIPIGASHRRGETFLYLHAGMADYAEHDCLYVA